MRSLLTILFSIYLFTVNAQITDDFQDGDFTNNPPWLSSDLSGNGADFQVNSGELQSFGPTSTAQLSITTSGIPDLTNFKVTWQFKARYASAPSSSNKIEVFLLSNNPDLNAAPEGYFIRMGETGSDDGIDFYKTSSGTPLILDANPSVASGIDVNIKVTRLTDGTWTIEADPTGGTSFTTIGSVNDSEFTTGNNFGFKVYHTSTRNQDFFFDDVSVMQTGVDTTPPSLNTLQVSGSNQLLLTFSEDLDQSSAETTTNYSLNNSVGSPQAAVLSPANQVTLTFSNDFANGDYTLTINNIDDLNANTLISTTSDFTIFVPDVPVIRDVIINELMADPAPAIGLPDAEFVELYNNSNKTFDLKDWTFSDASFTVTLATFILQPDSYVILCSSSNVTLFEPFGDVIGISSFPSLNNSGDDLSLKDNLGNLVDQVNYSSSWYKDEDKQSGGYSLELINPNNVCGGSENWIASNEVSGGTPGEINSVNDPTTGTSLPTLLEAIIINNLQVELHFSETLDSTTVDLVDFSITPSLTISTINQSNNIITLGLNTPIIEAQTYTVTAETLNDCTGNTIDDNNTAEFILIVNPPVELRDIIINEIMSIPSPTIGLPDAEFVELYNNSNKTFDLKDWTFFDASSTVTLATFILQPDSYVILCSSSNVTLFEPYGDVIGISSFPSLNNSGDELSLKDNLGNLVDQVNYSSSWYKDEDKQSGGYSLELINPNNVCGGSENWIASNEASGGTPGEINSVNDPTTGTSLPTLLEAIIINNMQVELHFSETLDSTTVDLVDFSITPSLTISTIDQSNNIITLGLNSPIIEAQTYTVTAETLNDCTGNTIDDNNTAEFILIVNPPVELRDIIINEIMSIPSPTIGLPDAEFVELYNNSNKTFDLKDWTFSDASSTVTLATFILQPDSYVILCSSSNVTLFEPFGDVIGISSFPSLNNSGDDLSLKDNLGNLVDQVNYSSSWYKDEDKQSGGYSLELINPNNVCGGSENWIASNEASGGTPGEINSVNDVSLGSEVPELVEVRAINELEVELLFSERVDSASVSLSDFQIDQGITIASFLLDNDIVTLLLGTPLTASQNYTVTVSGLSDCTSNVLSEQSDNFILIVNPPINEKDIIFNELMPNPSEETSAPNAEFVELYNRSDKAFNLQGWTITDGSSVGELPFYIFYPNTYAILTSTQNASKFDPSLAVLALTNLPSLNNAGDALALYSNSSDRVDTVDYNSSWYRSSIKDDGGYSLELIDPNNICADANNWIASEDESGATPGLVNSVLSEIPDNRGAVILNAFGTNSDTIVVIFDEKLDPASALEANYQLSSGLMLDHVAIGSANSLYLILDQTTPLIGGQEYTLTITNLLDCPGNLINENDNTVTFALLEQAEADALLINEVLFNPRPSGVDFVEIYNNSKKHISLKNWQLANGTNDNDSIIIGTSRVISEDHLIIGPGEYRVFTPDPIILKDQYPKGVETNFIEMNIPSYSDNEGIVILIKDSVFDHFEYSDDLHSELLSDTEGVSLERISFLEATNDPSNWISAVSGVGFATPGFVNSQMRGTIVSVKGAITIEPKVIIPDGSGQNEFATISYSFDQSGNVANVWIMDLYGREIKRIAANDYLGQSGFYTWDGSDESGNLVRIGYYIVYVEIFGLSGEVKKFKEKVVIGSRF